MKTTFKRAELNQTPFQQLNEVETVTLKDLLEVVQWKGLSGYLYLVDLTQVENDENYHKFIQSLTAPNNSQYLNVLTGVEEREFVMSYYLTDFFKSLLQLNYKAGQVCDLFHEYFEK
tara:strand:- start:665 stop:1015 length:351 start_codon:yes stop_codon:yes gene_type:complete